jgi:hypothetical protein
MWTNDTHHDLVSRNLWPRPEVANNHKLNTMPMHQNSLGGGLLPSSTGWTSSSARRTPMSVSTTSTSGDQSIISYDITQTKQTFTKSNHDAPTLGDSVWIGISHVFLPTFWCPKCNKCVSHLESLHDAHIHWQADESAKMGKQDRNKRSNHYSLTN